MSGFRIDFPRDQSIDANSTVRSGAKFYVYSNETTTPVTLYSDRDVATTRANPVVADSAGLFPVVYVATDALLTLTLKTSADVLLESWDDYEPVPSVDNADLANYVARAGGNANRMTGPLETKKGAAVASATSVDLDAATGNALHITGTTTIAAVTLAEGSLRWVVFDAALTLTHSSNLILPNSLDITTVAGDCALLAGEGSGVTRLLWYRCVDGKPLIESAEILVAIGDESTAIATGTAKLTFRMPFAMVLSALPRASLTAASSSGAVAIDINEAGASIFSTVLTIDQGALTSATAGTPAVLSDTSLADNAQMTIDIDDDGTNAAGLKVLLRGYRRNR